MIFNKPKAKPVFIPGLDDEPVCYCADCHSLKILVDKNAASGSWDGSYCGNCGSTEIEECTIDKWLEEEERLHSTDE